MGKYTNLVPIVTNREKVTLKRFDTFIEAATIMRHFFELGFRSFEAFKTIIWYYYPEIELLRLKKFWNCVRIDKEIKVKVIDVFEKLKNE